MIGRLLCRLGLHKWILVWRKPAYHSWQVHEICDRHDCWAVRDRCEEDF